MWVSIPVRDEEMDWIQRLHEPWRLSKDGLYRRSQVELALVTDSSWRRWGLPQPEAPILTLGAVDSRALEDVLQRGAQVVQPIQRQPWGAEVGFVRFPSGLLVEISSTTGGNGHGAK
ncbi:hypothetical protein [Alicyclobacillus macrosporangiidus]|uniref:hypothetical protein n=1 Tax=Alicyclobacillus macrosporangiidus TaxID=392015 RepID=UPI00049581AB|nr:hypothetical protein [Alicyclobacillus macrosporangiidus]